MIPRRGVTQIPVFATGGYLRNHRMLLYLAIGLPP